MNCDDHVRNIHEVWQIVQCEPHRQVTQGNCCEARPKKTFQWMPNDYRLYAQVYDSYLILIILHVCTSKWWSLSCRQWARSWPEARHNRTVLPDQQTTPSSWEGNDEEKTETNKESQLMMMLVWHEVKIIVTYSGGRFMVITSKCHSIKS